MYHRRHTCLSAEFLEPRRLLTAGTTDPAFSTLSLTQTVDHDVFGSPLALTDLVGVVSAVSTQALGDSQVIRSANHAGQYDPSGDYGSIRGSNRRPGDDQFYLFETSGGKLVVGGSSSPRGFSIQRYGSDGRVDESFAGDGIFRKTLKGNIPLRDIYVHSDGSITAVATTHRFRFDTVTVMRIDRNGRIDPAFGDNGLIEFNHVGRFEDLEVVDERYFVFAFVDSSTHELNLTSFDNFVEFSDDPRPLTNVNTRVLVESHRGSIGVKYIEMKSVDNSEFIVSAHGLNEELMIGKFSVSLDQDMDVGDGGWIAVPGEPTATNSPAVLTSSAGHIWFATGDYSDVFIYRFDSLYEPPRVFSQAGRGVADLLETPDGGAIAFIEGHEFDSLTKLTVDGQLATDFGANGNVDLTTLRPRPSTAIQSISSDENGITTTVISNSAAEQWDIVLLDVAGAPFEYRTFHTEGLYDVREVERILPTEHSFYLVISESNHLPPRIVKTDRHGHVDTTFDVDGVFEIKSAAASMSVNDATVGENGIIYITFFADREFRLIAIQADGQVVPGFSASGNLLARFGTAATYDSRVCVVGDSVLIAIKGSEAADNETIVLALNSDGTENRSVADGPIRIGREKLIDIACNREGAVVGGNGDGEIWMRTFVDGAPFGLETETTYRFGTLPTVLLDIGFDQSGHILATAEAHDYPNSIGVVARFDSDGNVDSSFGGNGEWTIDQNRYRDRLSEFHIAANGDVLVANYWPNTSSAPRTTLQRIEGDRIGPSKWQNATNPLDVDRDGSVSPSDALAIINRLNSRVESRLTPYQFDPLADPYLDTNGDGYVTASDALHVINHLNEQTLPSVPRSLMHDVALFCISEELDRLRRFGMHDAFAIG